MQFIKNTLAIIYCFFFISCNPDHSEQKEVVSLVPGDVFKIDIGKDANQDLNISKVIGDIALTPLIDRDTIFFAGKVKMQVFEDKIILGDKKLAQLYILNDSG